MPGVLVPGEMPGVHLPGDAGGLRYPWGAHCTSPPAGSLASWGRSYAGLAFGVSPLVLPLCSSASALLQGWQRHRWAEVTPLWLQKPGWWDGSNPAPQGWVWLHLVCPCTQDPTPSSSPGEAEGEEEGSGGFVPKHLAPLQALAAWRKPLAATAAVPSPDVTAQGGTVARWVQHPGETSTPAARKSRPRAPSGGKPHIQGPGMGLGWV